MSKARTVVREGLGASEAERAVLGLLALGFAAEAERRDSRFWTVSVAEDEAPRAHALIDEFLAPAPVPAPAAAPARRIWSSSASASAAFLVLVFVLVHLMVHRGFGPSARSRMLEAGAVVPYLVSSGEWWRLATAALLHFDVRHLVANSTALVFVGPPLALELGHVRLVILFAATAVAGNVVSQLLGSEAAIKAGASGGVCGVMGALAGSALAKAASTLDTRRPAWRTLGALAALFAMMVGFQPGRDHYAHVGGLLAGVALGHALLPRDRGRARDARD